MPATLTHFLTDLAASRNWTNTGRIAVLTLAVFASLC